MTTLRFGTAAALYEAVCGEKKLNQLSLLDKWLPGLIVTVESTGGEEKREAVFDDRDLHFHAAAYHGKLYQAGSSKRIAQILARLTGTSRSGQEKERRTAELIQRHVASELTSEKPPILALQKNAMRLLEQLTEAQSDLLVENLADYIFACAEDRSQADLQEKNAEAFPMDDDIFNAILTNSLSELILEGTQHLANALLWLLLGGLLRNNSWRLLHAFDSSFTMVHYHPSEDGSLLDQLHYILYPEDYYAVYEGDDLDSRFPGVIWKCDRCGATLNDQEGFSDMKPSWKCKACGYENRISADQIFETEDAYQSGAEPVDPEDFRAAVLERRTYGSLRNHDSCDS